jgi:hypothetical protein
MMGRSSKRDNTVVYASIQVEDLPRSISEVPGAYRLKYTGYENYLKLPQALRVENVFVSSIPNGCVP